MAEQLKEKASAEVAEKMKEWQPDKMSRAQQEKFVSSLLNIVKKEHQETETVVKGYELAWTVEGCTKFTKKAKKRTNGRKNRGGRNTTKCACFS